MKIIGTYITEAKIYKNNKLIAFKDVDMIKFKAEGFIIDILLNNCKPLNKEA